MEPSDFIRYEEIQAIYAIMAEAHIRVPRPPLRRRLGQGLVFIGANLVRVGVLLIQPGSGPTAAPEHSC